MKKKPKVRLKQSGLTHSKAVSLAGLGYRVTRFETWNGRTVRVVYSEFLLIEERKGDSNA